jgi:hypothetical protein
LIAAHLEDPGIVEIMLNPDGRLWIDRLRRNLVSKLKLNTTQDDKPVRLTIDRLATVHRDLVIYAEALGQGTGKATVEPAKLVPPMLARFMAADRAFAKLRWARSKQ